MKNSQNENERKQKKKKIDKHLDYIWKLKKLWNIKVVVIQMVIATFKTVSKELEKMTEGIGNQR